MENRKVATVRVDIRETGDWFYFHPTMTHDQTTFLITEGKDVAPGDDTPISEMSGTYTYTVNGRTYHVTYTPVYLLE